MENDLNSMPTLSVIVPNYNHAQFLSQRLDSILAQTFKDYELIALDDASSDESREVLARYAKQVLMRLVITEKNSGSPLDAGAP
jgi:glycosyltransferase involved in cell wall biosynthesis